MKYILPLLLIILVVSCRSARKITKTPVPVDSTAVINNPLESDSAKKVIAAMNKIKDDRIDFSTFTSKLKINYDGKDKDGNKEQHDLNAVIRMQKDSVIWLSVQAPIVGEVLRMMITPDSIRILNKIKNTVEYKKFDYLQEASKLPISFSDLQDLLIGNPLFLDSNIVSYSANETYTSLTTLGKEFRNSSMFINPGLNLQRTQLDDVDTSSNRSADLLYDQYQPNDNKMFAEKRKISIAYKTTTIIELEFKQPQFNTAVNFPFSVPDKYKLK
jgi:hypothetical protein